jgi:hypothetical protein
MQFSVINRTCHSIVILLSDNALSLRKQIWIVIKSFFYKFSPVMYNHTSQSGYRKYSYELAKSEITETGGRYIALGLNLFNVWDT